MGAGASKTARRSFSRPQNLKSMPEMQPTQVRKEMEANSQEKPIEADSYMQNLNLLLNPKVTEQGTAGMKKSNMELETIQNRTEEDEFLQHGVKNKMHAGEIRQLLSEFSDACPSNLGKAGGNKQSSTLLSELARSYKVDASILESLTTHLANPPPPPPPQSPSQQSLDTMHQQHKRR